MMRTTRALLALALLASLLSGCSWLRPMLHPQQATLPPPSSSAPSEPPPPRSTQPHDPPPLLHLSPASLGQSLALAQRIRIDAYDDQGQPIKRQIETMLEADADSLRIVLMVMGQTGAVLEWNGRQLKETRSVFWPSALRGDRILSELQLALWPADAVRAKLPEGWTLDEDGATRTLSQSVDGTSEPVIRIRYEGDALHDAASTVQLENLRDGYRLLIRSQSLE